MGKTDYTGGRGEAIAFTRLSRVCRADGLPYFWPHYLGEKCETFDLLVELVDAGEMTPFFFVSVKSTRQPYTKQTPPRLTVQVKEPDVRRMAAFPAPTYVVGVHEAEERAFVVSVHGGMSQAIPSITTGYELTCETLRMLWDEVLGYWQARFTPRSTSRFVEPNEATP
jgi:hypothetical protein